MNHKIAVLASLATLLGASSLLVVRTTEPSLDPPLPPSLQARRDPPPIPAAHLPREEPQRALAEPAPAQDLPVEEAGPALLERLGARLKREGVDPEWSAAAEGRVRAHLDTLEGIEPIDVACGMDLCRLELALLLDGNEPISKAQGAIPWHAPSFVAVGGFDEDSPTAILFVAREGYTLSEG